MALEVGDTIKPRRDGRERRMVDAADIDWVVISLQRTPKRLEQFLAVNGQLGLAIETFDAVDGLGVDPADLVRTGLMLEGVTWTPGAIGAALSHRLCWLRAVETGRPIVIFEDDVFLRHDFVPKALAVIDEVSPGWDLIQFGFNTDALLDIEVIPGCNVRGGFSLQFPTLEDCRRFVRSSGATVPMKLHNAFGNCSYAVSPSGAKKLLDGCFPLSHEPTSLPTYRAFLEAYSKDTLMNRLYRDMAAFTCVPPIAMPLNDKPASTVRVG